MTFKGTLKNAPQPLMTVTGSSDTVSTWEVGTPAPESTTLTAPFTLAATTPLAISVASSSGFVVGSTINVGGIACVVNTVSNGSLNVTPAASGAVASGAAVTQGTTTLSAPYTLTNRTGTDLTASYSLTAVLPRWTSEWFPRWLYAGSEITVERILCVVNTVGSGTMNVTPVTGGR